MTTSQAQPPKPSLQAIKDTVIIPEVHRGELGNGIATVNIEDSASELVYVSVVFRTGFAAEHKPGVSRLTVAMLKRGTTSRSAEQLSEELEEIGATISTRSHWDYTIVELKVLNEFCEKGMELLFDVLQNSVFPTEELERIKVQHKARIQQSYGEGDALAARVLGKVRFGEHSYGHDANGTEEETDSITIEDVKAHFESVVCHDNCFVATYSNFDAANVHAILSPIGSFHRPMSSRDVAVAPSVKEGVHIGICNKPEAKQTTMYVALPAVDVQHPDFTKLRLVNTILGGGFSSRLNMSIREEHGLTYGIGSSFDIRSLATGLVIGSSVKAEETKRAFNLILDEIRNLRDHTVPADELDRIKRFVMGSQAAKLENPIQQLLMVVSMDFHGQSVDDIINVYKEMFSAEPEDLVEVQQRYMQERHISVALAGDTQLLKVQFADVDCSLVEFDKHGVEISSLT